MSYLLFIFSYLLGGVTLVPLVLFAIYKFYLRDVDEDVGQEANFGPHIKNDTATKDNILSESAIEDNYKGGWITISREYFIYPSGGSKDTLKPPDPSANDLSMDKSTESAYSSLYKLMSSNRRGGNPGPPSLIQPSDSQTLYSTSSKTITDDNNNNSSKKSKSSKLTKLYAVIREGKLLLYPNPDTRNNAHKYLIEIKDHVVCIWPQNVPDGELFLKRSAICLVKREGLEAQDPNVTPKDAFFLYTDGCSEKEDLYFALIRASKLGKFPDDLREYDPNYMAVPGKIKEGEYFKLLEALQKTDPSTRWFNGLAGRLFLSVKDTAVMENHFRNRIVNKLSRVKRPSYLSEIDVKKIECGDSIPFFSNAKVHNIFDREGNLELEADVKYDGGFSVVVATKATLPLMKFKTDVSLLLKVKVKELKGRLKLIIKPPPSNRIWYAFITPPTLDLSTEPVISDKTVGFSYVTNLIENKIREIVKDTLVLPSMDDLTYFNTEDDFYRGGIWDYTDLKNLVEYEEKMKESEKEGEEEENGRSRFKINKAKTAPETSISSATEINEAVGNLRHRSKNGSIVSDMDVVTELDLNISASANSSDFNLADHIGELKGFGNTPNGKNGQSTQKEALANAGIATKKFLSRTWNSWYSKDKQMKLESKSNKSEVEVDSTSDLKLSPKISPIKLAPAPHEFPREFLNAIENGSNPYTPAPEMRLPMTYPSPQTGVNKSPPTKIPKRKPVGNEGTGSGEYSDSNSINDGTLNVENDDEKANSVDNGILNLNIDDTVNSLRESTSTITGDALELPVNEEVSYQENKEDMSEFKYPPSPRIVVTSSATLNRVISTESMISDCDSVMSNYDSRASSPVKTIHSRRMSMVSAQPSESPHRESFSFHPSPPTPVTTTISAITSSVQHTSSSVTSSPVLLPSSAPISASPSYTNILQPTTIIPSGSISTSPSKRSNTVKRKAVGSAPSRPRGVTSSPSSASHSSSDDEIRLKVVKSESLPI